jgi:putative inorganic carbon (HCO3(-)) transporter
VADPATFRGGSGAALATAPVPTRSLLVVLGAVAAAAAVLAAQAPGLVVLATVGGALLLLAAARPQLALLLLIAAGTLESFVPEVLGPQLTAVKLAGALAFATFLLEAAVTRRPLHLDRSHAVLGLLLALALVSSLGARSPGDAIAVTLRYASFVGLYVVATQQAHDERFPSRVAWIASLAAAVAAVLAIRNFVTGTTALAAPTYGDPNDLAFLLVTTLPLTLWLFRSGRASRVVVAAMVGAVSLGTLLALSRGALLALAVGVVWHAATERRHIPALLLAGVVAASVGLVAAQHNQERIGISLEQKRHIAQENVESRLGAWRAAAELSAEHPLTGVGPGNFGSYYFERTGRPPGTFGLRVVHDAYLDIAAELGVTGLVLFVAFLAMAFQRATVARRDGRGPPGFAAAVRTALIVAMVGALTLSEQYFPPFWVLGALATVLVQMPVRSA